MGFCPSKQFFVREKRGLEAREWRMKVSETLCG
jgi:hypothetical protein